MRLYNSCAVVCLLLINSVAFAGPTINTDKLTAPNPKIKSQLPKTMPEPQKKALKMAVKPRTRVTSAQASWTFPASSDGWCSSSSADQASVQITMNYTWPGEPYTNSMPALLKVKLPNGTEVSQPRTLYGSQGSSNPNHQDISGHFNFSRTQLCTRRGPQLCIQVRYAPANPADTNRVDQVWRPVCQPW